MYDISKIPKSLIDNDPIMREIIQGHKEESLALIHYERLIAPEAEKIPIETLSDVLSENIIKGLTKVWIYRTVTIPRRICKSDSKGREFNYFSTNRLWEN